MTQPTDRNRLDSAASPYLTQHADNPVNWQPWDDTALEAARDLDRPIFLSIGYSSCHWCHVMAEESFEDPAIAEQLNRDFVPIKVDREERPDLDSIYMTVCSQVTQGGCGWPLSVWLTPDLRPFYVGTYFPPTEKHGRPAFGDLLDSIADAWESDRDELEERGEAWLEAASEELESVPAPAEEDSQTDFLAAAGESIVETADRTHGGFGARQKFPHVDRLLVLAHLARRKESGEYEAVLEESLAAMETGGIRDFLGGGFHRYCVDRDWTVPHFEKMLYDNAEIPRAFLAGYQITGRDSFGSVAAQTFDFVDRELTHPEGGFYSTLDARSKPVEAGPDSEQAVEGAFYTWTPSSVRDAMEAGDTDSSDFDPEFLTRLFCEHFGVTESGNFEGETVLTRSRPVAALAEDFDRSSQAIQSALSTAIERATAARSTRPRPPRDEKILADWNGLMIRSLARGAAVLEEPRYAEMARDALDFVREHHWDGAQLAHRYKDGDRQGTGYLADYAFLARGAITLYEVTGDLEPLSFALDLAQAIKERFWDSETSTLFFTGEEASDLPLRPARVQEQSTPSSTGVTVEVLAALHHFDPAAGFQPMAEEIISTDRDRLESRPERAGTLAMAASVLEQGHLEVTIAAESIPSAWKTLLAERYEPDRLLSRRPPDETTLAEWIDTLDLESVPPIWAGRAARDGPTAFVCRRSCSPPITETSELRSWLQEFASE